MAFPFSKGIAVILLGFGMHSLRNQHVYKPATRQILDFRMKFIC